MTQDKTKEHSIHTETVTLWSGVAGFADDLEQRKGWDRLRKIGKFLAMLAAGFFFGGAKLPLSVYPLGCALVAALPCRVIAALIGVWLRCLYAAATGGDLLMYGIAATSVFLCRLIFCFFVYGKTLLARVHRLPDTVFTRVVLGGIMVLVFSVVDTIRRGISFSGILGALLSGIAAVAFSFLYYFFFEEEHKGTPAFEAGIGAAAFSAALAFLPFSIGTFSLGLTVSFAITLYVGFLGSPTRSSAVGLLCGLALGGYYAPVLALAGLVSGIFSEVHALLSGVAAVLVSVCGTLYFSGAEGVLEILPEILFSSFVIILFVCLGLLRTEYAKKEESEETAAVKDLLSRRRDLERERRMTGISHSMNALSGVIRGFSDKFRRPEPRKLTEKCREIWKEHCRTCPNASVCRGLSEPETEHVLNKLASRLMATGKIDHERLYEITKIRCPDLAAIAAKISALSAQMLEEAIREDKTQIFASDYEAMSQMFADAAAESDLRLPVDKILSDKLRRTLLRVGFHAENVVVCGDRKRFVIITGEDVTKSQLPPSTLHRICEEICGVSFGPPSFMLEKGNRALTLESIPLFSVETVSRQCIKDGETVCGDHFSVTQNYDGFYYAFLCDGMGSGEDAALTSHLCSVFLEKMLSCGNKKAITLEMLNHFLASRTTECFATVDLMEIDTVLGIASFLKSGAVPSYVIRNRHVYKIASGTFPIGILPEVSVEVTEFELCDGDVIVLCSDGISADMEAGETDEIAWFSRFIAEAWSDNLDEMADHFLRMANASAKPADDMTVALMRIRKE